MEEEKSAFNGFARQFVIRGDDSLSPQDFLRKVRKKMVDLLKNNPQTKVKMILNCLLVKPNLTTGEEIEDPFFHSNFQVNLGNENGGRND